MDSETIFEGNPPLGEQIDGTWNVSFSQELNMTTDNKLFKNHDTGVPLYEGKMFHQYNAYFSEPRYWLKLDEAADRVARKTGTSYQRARLTFRDVARSTDERTVIASIIPPNAFCGHTAIVETQVEGADMLALLALLNSFCVDWVARFRVDKHVTQFIMKSLPLPRLTPGEAHFDAIVPRAARLTCTRPAFADLWRAVMGSDWDESQGATAPAERQRLRDEIDAIVAHLYGLSRRDFDHILGTFPLVFPDDDAGRARRAALLETFDEWAARLG